MNRRLSSDQLTLIDGICPIFIIIIIIEFLTSQLWLRNIHLSLDVIINIIIIIVVVQVCKTGVIKQGVWV